MTAVDKAEQKRLKQAKDAKEDAKKVVNQKKIVKKSKRRS